MGKVIITAALTGIIYTKADNPNLPEQPEEIIRQARECRDAGAAIVHIHARDKQGNPTMDPSIVRIIYEGIRTQTDLIVQVSTSGALGLVLDDQVGSLSLVPELASLNLGPTILIMKDKEEPFLNPRSHVHHLAKKMLDLGIKPEMEIVNPALLQEVQLLIERGLVSPPYYVNLAFGLPEQGAMQSVPQTLVSLASQLPDECIFNVTSHGLSQLPMITISAVLGGHMRVGLEDNLFFREGVLAENNAQLVARAARVARELGHEPATPNEAREILRIPPVMSDRESGGRKRWKS